MDGMDLNWIKALRFGGLRHRDGIESSWMRVKDVCKLLSSWTLNIEFGIFSCWQLT